MSKDGVTMGEVHEKFTQALAKVKAQLDSARGIEQATHDHVRVRLHRANQELEALHDEITCLEYLRDNILKTCKKCDGSRQTSYRDTEDTVVYINCRRCEGSGNMR